MSSCLEDLRFGLRTFRRYPGFTLVVVLTLGSGIAAAALVFAIINAVLYNRYDVYREPNRLVAIWEQNGRLGTVGPASVRNVADWRPAAPSLERIGTYEPATFTLTGDKEPEAVPGGAIGDELLALLDARPALGRLFVPADMPTGPPRAVLLSHALWQRRYGGSTNIVGRVISVNGHPATVVGVTARGFTLAPFSGVEAEVMVPARDPLLALRSTRTAIVVGRLRPGATTLQARTELTKAADRLEKADAANEGWGVLVLNPMEFDFAGDGQFLVVVAVAVGLVLMIVCANVTNLLLSRAASRTREIATRLALGARRLRLARQFLTESLMLGVGGSLAGLFLAYCACRAVTWSISGTAVGYLTLALDARVVSFTVVVSLGCALLVGVLPAIRLSRTSLMAGLKDGFSGGAAGLSASRVRTMLVALEVALAVVLLAAAGLVLAGVANLRGVTPGFRADGLMTQRLILPDGRYPDLAARARFAEELVARLQAHPGIAGVAVTSHLPAIGGEAQVCAFTPERPRAAGEKPPAAWVIATGADYFRTMGIPLKAGRGFAEGDRAGTQPVAVVSDGLARRWLGDTSPIGSRILLEGEWRTIVGVAADVRNFHLNVAPAPAIYVPFGQRAAPGLALVLRAARGEPLALAGTVKSAIRALDADVPLRPARSHRTLIEESLGGFDLTRLLVGALAGAALILAAIGIYAVVAYSVTQRTREFGVRMALGAGPLRLQRQVVAEGLWLAAKGGVPGLVLALMIGRLLSSKLHGVSAADPLLFGATVTLVVTTVLVASWVPARRAARVDPAVATRTE